MTTGIKNKLLLLVTLFVFTSCAQYVNSDVVKSLSNFEVAGAMTPTEGVSGHTRFLKRIKVDSNFSEHEEEIDTNILGIAGNEDGLSAHAGGVSGNPIGIAWEKSSKLELVANISALRAYVRSGGITEIQLTDNGVACVWRWVDGSTDTDNVGTVVESVVDSSGRWKRFHSGAGTPEWFGAVGDGTTDDTVAINLALDSGLKTITGNGNTYAVTTLLPHSNVTLKNINLIAMPSATTVSMRPVIKVGGEGVAVNNVDFISVKINGNRNNLKSISFSNGEDGGMHGFRISDLATNIRLINCEANYCGTAGLAIHNSTTGLDSVPYKMKNIYIENFKAEYNREHGMFGSGFDSLIINGAELNYNGLTLVEGETATHGSTGASVGGVLFGKGFDLETYVNSSYSYFKNAFMKDVRAAGNARHSELYIPNPVTESAGIPAQNIHLLNVYLEAGVAPSADGKAFGIVADTHDGSNYGVDTVLISGYMSGYLDTNNVKRLSYTEGFINSTTDYKAIVQNGSEINVTVPSNQEEMVTTTLGSLSISSDVGVGALTQTGSISRVNSNGVHTVTIPFSISNALISGGNMSFTIDVPPSMEIVKVTERAWNKTSALPVVTSNKIVSPSQFRLYVVPTSDLIAGRFDIEILLK
jgi:hypothetical protein